MSNKIRGIQTPGVSRWVGTDNVSRIEAVTGKGFWVYAVLDGKEYLECEVRSQEIVVYYTRPERGEGQ